MGLFLYSLKDGPLFFEALPSSFCQLLSVVGIRMLVALFGTFFTACWNGKIFIFMSGHFGLKFIHKYIYGFHHRFWIIIKHMICHTIYGIPHEDAFITLLYSFHI